MATPAVGTPPLHPGVSSLAFLVGTWRGEGTGNYPSIEAFGYGEEVRFAHVGKPYLSYLQRTWHADDGRPLHAETGYLRAGPAGEVELMVAHPTGVVELSEGTVEGTTIELHSRLVGCSSSAKPVTTIGRLIEVRDDELRYRLSMAAVGYGAQQHLEARLHRTEAGPAGEGEPE